MRIALIITRGDFPGGAQVHLVALACALRDRGHLVEVIVGQPGPLGQELAQMGIPVHAVAFMVHPLNPWLDFRALVHLVRLLGRLQPDLVAAHSSKAGLLARLAARIVGLPSVFTAHGWSFTEGVSVFRRHLFRWLEACSVPLLDRAICVSEYDRALALASKVGTPESLVTVHNGIATSGQEPVARPEKDDVRLIMVARLGDPKEPHRLLEALARLPSRVSLDLVGEGPQSGELTTLAKDLGIESRVRFLGRREDVPELLADASVFVLVSRYEAFPLSILEAMRAGLPVVASDVGGVREAVVEGETGYLVPRGDLTVLVNRLSRLIDDPGSRARMGEAGRKRFHERFTLDEMVQRTEAVYQDARLQYKRRRSRPSQGART